MPRALGPIQGSIAVVGAEVRYAGGAFGDGYLGYSHIDARNINALADSLEVVHSRSGYNFKQNFFGRTYDPHTGIYNGPQNETGTVDNIGLPVRLQLRRAGALSGRLVGRRTRRGDDRLRPAVDRRQQGAADRHPQDPVPCHHLGHEHEEAEVGVDAVYTPLYWLGFNARFDMVQPDLDAAYARTPGISGGSERASR